MTKSKNMCHTVNMWTPVAPLMVRPHTFTREQHENKSAAMRPAPLREQQAGRPVLPKTTRSSWSVENESACGSHSAVMRARPGGLGAAPVALVRPARLRPIPTSCASNIRAPCPVAAHGPATLRRADALKLAPRKLPPASPLLRVHLVRVDARVLVAHGGARAVPDCVAIEHGAVVVVTPVLHHWAAHPQQLLHMCRRRDRVRDKLEHRSHAPLAAPQAFPVCGAHPSSCSPKIVLFVFLWLF